MPTENDARGDDRPEEWTLYDGPYFMRSADADAGRLVRLARVVRWLMKSQELPRPHAAERVCAALEQARPQPQLFLVKPNDYAAPAPADALYGGHSTATLEAAKRKATQDALQRGLEQERRNVNFSGRWYNEGRQLWVQGGRITFVPPTLVEPGIPAALWHLRQWWGNTKAPDSILDDSRKAGAMMSVLLSDAAALWGYRVAAAAAAGAQEGAAQPVGANGKVWTEKRLRDLLADHDRFKRDGDKDPTKKAAQKYGVKDTTIKTKLAAARKLGDDKAPRKSKSPATPFSVLVHRLK